jgi:hypothetical protein
MEIPPLLTRRTGYIRGGLMGGRDTWTALSFYNTKHFDRDFSAGSPTANAGHGAGKREGHLPIFKSYVRPDTLKMGGGGCRGDVKPNISTTPRSYYKSDLVWNLKRITTIEKSDFHYKMIVNLDILYM